MVASATYRQHRTKCDAGGEILDFGIKLFCVLNENRLDTDAAADSKSIQI